MCKENNSWLSEVTKIKTLMYVRISVYQEMMKQKEFVSYKCQIEDMYDCGKRRLQAFQLSLEKSEECL